MLTTDQETTLKLKALKDKVFRSELIQNPKETIAKLFGIKMQDDFKLNVVQESPKEGFLVLPSGIEATDLSEEQLLAVAGGGCSCGSTSTSSPGTYSCSQSRCCGSSNTPSDGVY